MNPATLIPAMRPDPASAVAGDVLHLNGTRLSVTIGWELASLPGLPRQRLAGAGGIDPAAILLTELAELPGRCDGLEIAFEAAPLAAAGALRLAQLGGRQGCRQARFIIDGNRLPIGSRVLFALRAGSGTGPAAGFRTVAESWLRCGPVRFECPSQGSHDALRLAWIQLTRRGWDLRPLGEPVTAGSWRALTSIAEPQAANFSWDFGADLEPPRSMAPDQPRLFHPRRAG